MWFVGCTIVSLVVLLIWALNKLFHLLTYISSPFSFHSLCNCCIKVFSSWPECCPSMQGLVLQSLILGSYVDINNKNKSWKENFRLAKKVCSQETSVLKLWSERVQPKCRSWGRCDPSWNIPFHGSPVICAKILAITVFEHCYLYFTC